MKKAVTKVINTLTQEDFDGAFQKLLERYNKCIAAGGDYFKGDKSFMCALAIKVPTRKKSLKTYRMHLVYQKIAVEFINELCDKDNKDITPKESLNK